MPRSRVRPPHEALKTVTKPCADCGQAVTVRVEEHPGRHFTVPTLCPPCLALRVAQVQAAPAPRRPRGPKPRAR